MLCSGRSGRARCVVAPGAEAREGGALARDGAGPHHHGRFELRVLLLFHRHEGAVDACWALAKRFYKGNVCIVYGPPVHGAFNRTGRRERHACWLFPLVGVAITCRKKAQSAQATGNTACKAALRGLRRRRRTEHRTACPLWSKSFWCTRSPPRLRVGTWSSHPDPKILIKMSTASPK